MKARISHVAVFRSVKHPCWLALLIFLSWAVVGWGQQRPRTGATRGRPRATQLKVIQLPAPMVTGGGSVEQAIAQQQNLPAPTDLRLTFSEIGQLLWAVQGVAVPQSGATVPDALIPMKVYVALPDGLYLYSPSTHALQQLRDTDLRPALAQAVTNQQGAPLGGCQIILAGTTADFSARFGKRAKTAMLLLGGQMAQSLQLQAIGLDLTYLAVNDIEAQGVSRICRLGRTLLPLYIAIVGYPPSRMPATSQGGAETSTTAAETANAATPVAKAVIITPQREFQDEEFFQTRFALENASIQTVVASSRPGRILGSRGGIGEATLGLGGVNVDDFDALIFIGGAGAVPFASNSRVQELVRQAIAKGKLVAASGTAALILANAGVIKSVRVTGLPAHQQLFVLAGGIYTGSAVEKDGQLITSAGPLVAPQFARLVVDSLTNK